MLFDEAEVFKGLTAWFSSSVPAKVKSQWVKNGGIQKDDINDADYIFSSEAAAKDTLWIFESQKYQNEELTIFDSSLIEDTITSGKSYLSGKYIGSYILIHPAYQKEIDSFLREKCPRIYRSNIQPTTVVDHNKVTSHVMEQQINKGSPDQWDFTDDLGIGANTLSNSPRKSGVSGHQLSCDGRLDEREESVVFIKSVPQPDQVSMGELTTEHQDVGNHTSDQWDFKDESNIHVKNLSEARRLSQENTVNCANKNCNLSSHPSLSSVPKPTKHSTVKQRREKPLSNRQENIVSATSAALIGKDKRKCLAHYTDINMLDENYLTNSSNHPRKLVEDTRQQRESRLQDAEERSNLVDDAQFTNVTSGAPVNPRSHFLSSMDDGVVHIDDIKLPNTPILDFIPNYNGCRVDSK